VVVSVRTENNPERIMFTLHRWTGVILLIYFAAHAITMGLLFAGNMTAARIASSIITNKIVLWIVAVIAVFHGLNGIRLLIVEAMALGIGKPELPKPPYISTSLRSSQRMLLYCIIACIVAASIIATFAIYTL
jgi:succinate dehydrogenase / fumarate reductase cytochrome b subunit